MVSREFDPLDEALGLTLTRAVAGGDFRGQRGETLLLYRHGERGPDRVLLVGVGERTDLSAERLREVGGRAASRARELGVTELSLSPAPAWPAGPLELEAAVRAMVEGVVLGEWRFEELRSEADEDARRPRLGSLGVLVLEAGLRDEAARGVELGRVVAAAQNYARELAIRPGNIVNPRYLAGEARRLGDELGFKVTVLDRAKLEKDGLVALLAVAAGSDEEPRFIAMEYRGAEGKQRLVLVGKGVTFDAGGLSQDPGEHGEDEVRHVGCGGGTGRDAGDRRAGAGRERGRSRPGGREPAFRPCDAPRRRDRLAFAEDDRGGEHGC